MGYIHHAAQHTSRGMRDTPEAFYDRGSPNFSEAPDLRSFIPYPKTDFSKNQIASRPIIPWPESTNFFGIKIDIPTNWGQGTPSFRNKIAEMCYLYSRTGPHVARREKVTFPPDKNTIVHTYVR